MKFTLRHIIIIITELILVYMFYLVLNSDLEDKGTLLGVFATAIAGGFALMGKDLFNPDDKE
jgi:Na+-transporting NADH:ubiquinone oxidoreductase subunit NqrB